MDLGVTSAHGILYPHPKATPDLCQLKKPTIDEQTAHVSFLVFKQCVHFLLLLGCLISYWPIACSFVSDTAHSRLAGDRMQSYTHRPESKSH